MSRKPIALAASYVVRVFPASILLLVLLPFGAQNPLTEHLGAYRIYNRGVARRGYIYNRCVAHRVYN
jgi:hypothetical protein